MIFYFTGTGNSKHAAQMIAESENDMLYSITQAVRERKFTYNLDDEKAIGFVFPVYFGGLPSIVQEFIENVRFENIKDKYVYLLLTCGGKTYDAGGMFAKRMAERGYQVDALYGVRMPDNYVPMFNPPTGEKAEALLAQAVKEIREIALSIQARKKGDMIAVKGMFPKAATALMYPFYDRTRKTKKFYATDACTGCGLCEKICPCGAIELKNGKPVWVKEICAQCFGCLHRCPVRAIQFGKGTDKRERYVNPYSEGLKI